MAAETLVDCYSQTKKANVLGTQLDKKMKFAKEKTKIISRIVEGDRKAFIESKIQKMFKSKFSKKQEEEEQAKRQPTEQEDGMIEIQRV